MIRRFQIEDLIVQDGSGVVFRALDTETGKTVALRRFFPFGAHGGGLKDDEKTAYNIALGRLAGLSHPALRSVICGGCDPVDGIPFIATEWIEGASLGPIVQERPLPADAAVLLLIQALEVCELISHVLAEEAVWVETHIDTIIMSDLESGRGFTFWICPLKWLGHHQDSRGLESIITLTDKIMSWKGHSVNDAAGGGLGAWLQWMRKAALTSTLREARENLAAAIGSDPPPAAKQLVSAATRPRPQKSSKHFLLAGLGLLLIITGLGGWLVTRNRSLAGSPDLAMRSSEAKNGPLPKKEQAVAKSSPVFSPAESALLIKEKGRIVTLEAQLVETGASRSNKTRYLYFSENPPANEVRVALAVENAAGFNSAQISGKKLRITGKVKVFNDRPEIVIPNPAAIEAVE